MRATTAINPETHTRFRIPVFFASRRRRTGCSDRADRILTVRRPGHARNGHGRRCAGLRRAAGTRAKRFRPGRRHQAQAGEIRTASRDKARRRHARGCALGRRAGIALAARDGRARPQTGRRPMRQQLLSAREPARIARTGRAPRASAPGARSPARGRVRRVRRPPPRPPAPRRCGSGRRSGTAPNAARC